MNNPTELTPNEISQVRKMLQRERESTCCGGRLPAERQSTVHEQPIRKAVPKEEPYTAWAITAEHLADKPGTNRNAVGLIGPRPCALSYKEICEHPQAISFCMYDDGGNLYYEGRAVCLQGQQYLDRYAPLNDFGRSNSGCTKILYDYDDEWEDKEEEEDTSLRDHDYDYDDAWAWLVAVEERMQQHKGVTVPLSALVAELVKLCDDQTVTSKQLAEASSRSIRETESGGKYRVSAMERDALRQVERDTQLDKLVEGVHALLEKLL